MAARTYSNVAVVTTITAAMTNVQTTATIASATGWPSAPFTMEINSEVILVGARSGTSLSSLTRGYDGTTAAAHSSGDGARIVAVAADFSLIWSHVHSGSSGDDTSLIDIADAADVTLTSVGDDEILVYDTSGWVNKTLAEAGIAAAVHNHDADYVELAGDTMTGNLTIDPASGTASLTIDRSADTVGGAVLYNTGGVLKGRVGLTSGSSEAMYLTAYDGDIHLQAQQDDASAANIYFWADDSGGTARQRILIDGDGNTTFADNAGASRLALHTSGVNVTGTLTVSVDPTTDSHVGDRGYNDARYATSGHGHSVAHSATTGQTANDHHNQQHAIDGSDHTGTLAHSALGSVSANQHHNEDHAARHSDGGADEIEISNLAAAGATGFILERDGAGGLQWIATPGGGSSPLTTKGDLFTYDTGDARLPVGTNGQFLLAASGEATGLDWTDTFTADISLGGFNINNIGQLTFGASGPEILDGTGDPESSAPQASLYLKSSGNGARLFYKMSGTGNTGWEKIAGRRMFDVEHYGAVGDASTNDQAAIASAVSAAEAASPKGTVYFAAKIFKINSKITFTNCSVYAEPGAQLLVDSSITGTAVQIGTASTYCWNQKLVLPEIVRNTQSWSQTSNVATVLNDIGLELVAVRECEIYVKRVSKFSYGMDLAGDTKGISYNNIYLSWFENNAVSMAFRPVNAGWSNENQFYGGRLELQQNGATGRIQNTKLMLVGENTNENQPNNNRFFGICLEGNWDEYAIECWGAYNFWYAPRLEGSGKAVTWKAYSVAKYAQGNEIYGGYNTHAVTYTDDADAKYNNVYHPQKSWIEGSDQHGFWRLANRYSSSRGIAFYATGTSLYDHDDDDWLLNLSAGQILTKAAADTEARIYIWNTLGRLYFGPGGTTVPSMYVRADNATTLGLYGATGGFDLKSAPLISPADPTVGTHVGDRDYNDARYATSGHGHSIAHSATTGQTANDHHNEDHAARHSDGGADEIDVVNLASSGATGSYLERDGSGGLQWSVPSSSSPLTSKGDLFGYDTDDARIPVGTNNTFLIADSAQSLGVKWGNTIGALNLAGDLEIDSGSAGSKEIRFTSSGTAWPSSSDWMGFGAEGTSFGAMHLVHYDSSAGGSRWRMLMYPWDAGTGFDGDIVLYSGEGRSGSGAGAGDEILRWDESQDWWDFGGKEISDIADPTNDSGVGDRGYNDARYVHAHPYLGTNPTSITLSDSGTPSIIWPSTFLDAGDGWRWAIEGTAFYLGFYDASVGAYDYMRVETSGNIKFYDHTLTNGVVTYQYIESTDKWQYNVDLNMNNNTLSGPADPTLGTHVGDRDYNDARYHQVTVDHGGIGGLADDDHTQYLLVSGTRAMTGSLDMGTEDITNAGYVAASYFRPDGATADIVFRDGGAVTRGYYDYSDTKWRFGSTVVVDDRLESNNGNLILADHAGKTYIDIRDGEMYFYVNSAWEYHFDGTKFEPYVDDANDLGTSSKQWQNLYVGGIYNYHGDMVIRNNAASNLIFDSYSANRDIYFRTHNGTAIQNRIFIDGSTNVIRFSDHDGNSRFDLNAGQIIAVLDGTASAPTYSWSNQSNSGMRWQESTKRIYFCNQGTDDIVMTQNGVYPAASNVEQLGNSTLDWKDVWAIDTTINSSDETLKRDMAPIDPTVARALIKALEPIEYKWIDGGERYHWGYGARQVKQSLIDAGLDPAERGIFIDPKYGIAKEEDESSDLKDQFIATEEEKANPRRMSLRLRPTEMIPVVVTWAKDTDSRVEALEAELAELKETLAGLVAGGSQP